MVVAKKSARAKDATESTNPTAISNISPDMKMLLISLILSSERYWAAYLIMAEFMPQSLNIAISVGAVRAIPYRPYRSEPSKRAMKIVPTAEMIVDATKPHSRWKPPRVETLAISAALLNLIVPNFELTYVDKRGVYYYYWQVK